MSGCGCHGASLLYARLSRRAALRAAGVVGGGVAAALALRQTARAEAALQQPGAPSLQQLAEDVYLWSDSGYNKLFIVTDAGVLATDPSAELDPAVADRYKAAIASVTSQPVRYLVYSHNHADHSYGGNVFADTAQFVGHRLAAPKIAARNEPRNPPPTILVDDSLSLDLGGKTVELYYTGRNHSDNSLVLLYRARRIAFAVDFIPVRAVAFRDFPDAYPDEWVASLEWIDANLEFDTLAPGHGAVGTKADVGAFRQYLLDLMAAIRAARAAGLADNSPEMVASVRAALEPRYGTWDQFGPWLSENIEGLTRLGFTR